jgi:hypothetical protein
MPSLGQSGLKINLPGGKLDIGEGETIVMLDFDAAESFGHQAGNSGKWVMHPVVKATNVTFGGNALVQQPLGKRDPARDVHAGRLQGAAHPGRGRHGLLTFTDATAMAPSMRHRAGAGQYTLSSSGRGLPLASAAVFR